MINAEFNWWLLIVGLVFGAALVYLALAETSRREADVEARERAQEAAWIAAVLRDEGIVMEPATAHRVLELHREYLGFPPPDDPEPDPAPVEEVAPVSAADPRSEGNEPRDDQGGTREPASPS